MAEPQDDEVIRRQQARDMAVRRAPDGGERPPGERADSDPASADERRSRLDGEASFPDSQQEAVLSANRAHGEEDGRTAAPDEPAGAAERPEGGLARPGRSILGD